MSKKKLFKISAVAASFLIGMGLISKAESAKVGSNNSNFEPYCAAYEFYGNQRVLAGQSPEDPAVIQVTLGRNYLTGTLGILRVLDGEFLRISEYQTLLGDTDIAKYCLYNGTDVVAVEQAFTPTAINFRFTQYVANNSTLTLALCDGTNAYLYNSTMVYIKPNLGANCENCPEVKVGWDATDDCANGTLIVIKRKVVNTFRPKFNAQLNALDGFKTFAANSWEERPCGNNYSNIGFQLSCESGNNTFNACYAKTNDYLPSVDYVTNWGFQTQVSGGGGSGGGGGTIPCDCEDWVLGKNFTANDAIVAYKFTIESLNPEPGVKISILSKQNNVTYACKQQDDRHWVCETDCTLCPNCIGGDSIETNDNIELIVQVDGNSPLSATQWKLVDAQIVNKCVQTDVIKDICCEIKSPQILGYWYGGYDAVIPFVKYDPSTGYNTFIKLYNRYDQSVKVYAIPFTEKTPVGSGSILWAYQEIGTIPAHGMLEIWAGGGSGVVNLKDIFPNADFVKGTPFKLLIGVPTTPGILIGDPYIEGIVISVYPGGGQRQIPLKFKSWKYSYQE